MSHAREKALRNGMQKMQSEKGRKGNILAHYGAFSVVYVSKPDHCCKTSMPVIYQYHILPYHLFLRGNSEETALHRWTIQFFQ